MAVENGSETTVVETGVSTQTQTPEDPRIASIRTATAALLASQKDNPHPWPPDNNAVHLGRKIMAVTGQDDGAYLQLITGRQITKTETFALLPATAQAVIIAALDAIQKSA